MHVRGFARDDLRFSLCGLKCCLCPMKLDGYCPGCGGGAGNQSCAIARCGLDHGGVAYCGQCPDYPCGRYEAFDAYDSFITHQHRRADMERLESVGWEAFHGELAKREEILQVLLEHYNDGRKKNLFCLAANLLELPELERAVERVRAETGGHVLSIQEKAAAASQVLKDAAARQGIELKLNRRPPRKKN